MISLEKIKDAGIIGAGGAGFPTHVKLKSKAEFIILNGAECEPLLRVDQQLMEYYPGEIIEGLRMAGELVGAKKAIIGIKHKHKKVIEILNSEIGKRGLVDKVTVHELPDIYPAGDEQVLVYEVTGRVVPELGIPIAVGCIVINTETVLNIWNASKDEPVTMKYVTVSGDVPSPITVKVPVGTPIRLLLAVAGRGDMNGYMAIDGGPMMGHLMANLNGFITKKTKGLVVLPEEHSLINRKKRTVESSRVINRSACEQCRMCTDLCPRSLLGHSTSPHKMVRAMSFGAPASEEMLVAQTCCQCNLCDYFSCPAGINPKLANVFYMDELRKLGMRYDSNGKNYNARSIRKYRLIPSKRLMARLNINAYDNEAPLIKEILSPEMVGMVLNSHVGAPAKPLVNIGQKVSSGELIAEIPDGSLGANVHSSIDGIVEEIREGLIIVRGEANV